MWVEIGLSDGGKFGIFFFDPGPETLDLGKCEHQDGQEFLILSFEGDIRTDLKLADIKFFNEVKILFFKPFELVIEHIDFIMGEFLFFDLQSVVIVGMLKLRGFIL